MTTPEIDQVGSGSRAGDRLLATKERVIALWEMRLREVVPAAEQAAHGILVDTLPAILDHLVQALSPGASRRVATQGSTVAAEHGGERVRMTVFRLEDLIVEYKLLREVLFEVLDEGGPVSMAERNTLNASLDQAIMEACTGYALVQSALRDQLFAIVAHDLRSPLSGAQMMANLILTAPNATEVPHWAQRVIDNIGRVDRMVQDLLDATRVQTGARLELELDECDLVEIVRKTLEHLTAEHGDRFILTAPEPVRGYFAADALRRAVENLATNAVKYGTPARSIMVTVRELHERALIAVHNDGAHIPAEKQETLFRAFQRASGQHTIGQRGWGLGLAQVRAVAEAHGGSIVVDSVPDRGTTFTIDIPLDARSYQMNPTTSGY